MCLGLTSLSRAVLTRIAGVARAALRNAACSSTMSTRTGTARVCAGDLSGAHLPALHIKGGQHESAESDAWAALSSTTPPQTSTARIMIVYDRINPE